MNTDHTYRVILREADGTFDSVCIMEETWDITGSYTRALKEYTRMIKFFRDTSQETGKTIQIENPFSHEVYKEEVI